MKYIILTVLFLVGCDSYNGQLSDRVDNLERSMRGMDTNYLYLSSRVDGLSEKVNKELPKIDDDMCVKFTRYVDTHAIASGTIPVDGKYYVSTWNEPERVNYYKNGTVIFRVKELIRDTCPDFERMKRAGIIKWDGKTVILVIPIRQMDKI